MLSAKHKATIRAKIISKINTVKKVEFFAPVKVAIKVKTRRWAIRNAKTKTVAIQEKIYTRYDTIPIYETSAKHIQSKCQSNMIVEYYSNTKAKNLIVGWICKQTAEYCCKNVLIFAYLSINTKQDFTNLSNEPVWTVRKRP